nr:hypothetical protein [Tanacetum cinerariifolium]
ETINDNFSDFTVISNTLFDEFYGPSIPINILEEERTKRDHADYINRMEMLFTINPRPHNPTNDNTNVKSFSSFQIPNQESKPRQEEIDVISETNDVLPPSNDDSDDEVDVDGDLRVDNVIQNSEHEYTESEDSDLDNSLLPLPPPEPPDKEFDFKIDFEKEISVERNLIVKFECIDERMKFDVENDVFKFIMFSLLSAESEDTIFDPGFLVFCVLLLLVCVVIFKQDYPKKIEAFLCRILSWSSRSSYPLIDSSLGKSISVIYIGYSLIVPPLYSMF